MKVIISSIVLAFVLAAIASFVLGTFQKTADVAFATSGARVGTATTTHMVGPKWTGLDAK